VQEFSIFWADKKACFSIRFSLFCNILGRGNKHQIQVFIRFVYSRNSNKIKAFPKKNHDYLEISEEKAW